MPPSTRRLPTHTISGSQVKIEVPTAWYCTIVGISRKTYNQTVRIRHGLLQKNYYMESEFEKANETMRDALTSQRAITFATQKAPLTLTFDFFFAKESDKSGVDIAEAQYQSSKVQAVTFSKPPGAVKSIPDYRSYFIFVEDGQQPSGDTEFDDVVLTLQMFYVPEDDVVNPKPDPPKPPTYVKPGYNDSLDRKRESTIENYLRYYDTVFLIDDSGSMNEVTTSGAKKWVECINALDGIAGKAITYDDDGIEYYFFNNVQVIRLRDFPNVTAVGNSLRALTANGGTPTGSKVRERLEAHLAVLARTIGTPAYARVKPLDLIVITDGSPDTNNQPLPVIVEIAARMKAAGYHPNSIGIQFVQIGNDAGAEASLQTMAAATNVGSMIDTVPYKSALTPAELERILLGGLHPNLRPGYKP
ncbi:hypothetical protein BD779DRAFT_1550408 [Infundibulicybe gibba]|nr:hypothetical protein BD779DRAFT_1550408 [Infundibulicybe gibba]